MIDTLPSNDDARISGTFGLVNFGGLAATLLPLMTGMISEIHDYTPRSPYAIQIQEARSSVSRIEFGSSVVVQEYQPRTPLAKKLLAIRERAIAKGMVLLTKEEVFREIESRRGEINRG